jgi:hypothetical protein
MQAVITHPGGIVPGMASEEARSGLEVGPDTLEEVVAPSSRLSGAERLALYGRSYFARLLESFRAMFPGLLAVLGRDLFDRFALDYLRRHPPGSYTLNRLADAFPRHLAETRPDAAAPPEEREAWADLIVELATLELALQKVYDGPGVEGRTLPGAREVREIPEDRLLAARPVPVPCLRLFAFRFPVHTCLLAARRGEGLDLPAPAASFVAMTRRDYRVILHELAPEPYFLLQALDGQRSVAQALALREGEGSPPTAIATVRDWLCDWTGKGFFERLGLATTC